MAFTVNDVRDLIRLLAEHPEWRAELRPLILGDEFVGVPARIAAIDERIAAMAAEIAAINVRIAEMDARIAAIDERIADLDARFTGRFEAVDRRLAEIDVRIAEVDARIANLDARFTGRFDALDGRLNRMEGRLGNLDGERLEERFSRHARDWLTLYFSEPSVIKVADLAAVLAARADGTMSEGDYRRILDADILATGRTRDGDSDLVIAGEVAGQIDVEDVARAEATVTILRSVGYAAKAFVAGHEIEPAARSMAESLGIVVDLRRRSG